MRLAAPAIPENWQLQRREDGSARATVTRLPAGWAAGLAVSLALPFFWCLLALAGSGLLMWTVALGLLLGLLVHFIDRVVHGTFGTEIWCFSPSGLNIRKSVFGFTWWNVDYYHGTLSIATEASATWELRFQNGGSLYSLFRSETLDDVLGLASFLQEELGWPLSFTDTVPQCFQEVVESALATHDRERIQLLLQDERLVPQLARYCDQSHLRGFLRDLEAETGLLKDLADRGGAEARGSAVVLLGGLADAAALPVLRRALDDPAGQVRLRAAVALGRLRDREAVPALCAALQYAPDLRDAAVIALGQIGDPTAIDALAALLSGLGRVSDASCRVRILQVLGELQVPSALPVVARALQDPTPGVRAAAADALGVLGGGEAVSPLAAALSDPELRVALRAAAALERIHDAGALRVLAGLWTSDRFELRARAIRARAALGEPGEVRELCHALNDAESAVRYEAAAGLFRVAKNGSTVPLEVRAALPHLRRLYSPLSAEPADVKHACREAVREIERATAKLKQLPVPAKGSATAPALLPVPVPARVLDPPSEAMGQLRSSQRPSDGRW